MRWRRGRDDPPKDPPRCVNCGEPINPAGPYWFLAFVPPPEDKIESMYLGSMACFVAWSTDLAVHYLDHVAAEGDPRR
jgi:hypothetical protein